MAERKGKKLRRCTAASKAYYKVQFGKTDANKKKRMQKHLRAQPDDLQAIQRYEMTFGHAKDLGLSCAGRRQQMRRIHLLKRGPKPRKPPVEKPVEAPL